MAATQAKDLSFSQLSIFMSEVGHVSAANSVVGAYIQADPRYLEYYSEGVKSLGIPESEQTNMLESAQLLHQIAKDRLVHRTWVPDKAAKAEAAAFFTSIEEGTYKAPDRHAAAQAEAEPEAPAAAAPNQEAIITGLQQYHDAPQSYTYDTFRGGFVALDPGFEAVFQAIENNPSAGTAHNQLQKQVEIALNENPAEFAAFLSMAGDQGKMSDYIAKISTPEGVSIYLASLTTENDDAVHANRAAAAAEAETEPEAGQAEPEPPAATPPTREEIIKGLQDLHDDPRTLTFDTFRGGFEALDGDFKALFDTIENHPAGNELKRQIETALNENPEEFAKFLDMAEHPEKITAFIDDIKTVEGAAEYITSIAPENVAAARQNRAEAETEAAEAEAAAEIETDARVGAMPREQVVAGLKELHASENKISLKDFRIGFERLNPAYGVFFDEVENSRFAGSVHNELLEQVETALNESPEAFNAFLSMADDPKKINALTSLIQTEQGSSQFVLSLAEASGMEIHSIDASAATPIDGPEIKTVEELVVEEQTRPVTWDEILEQHPQTAERGLVNDGLRGIEGSTWRGWHNSDSAKYVQASIMEIRNEAGRMGEYTVGAYGVDGLYTRIDGQASDTVLAIDRFLTDYPMAADVEMTPQNIAAHVEATLLQQQGLDAVNKIREQQGLEQIEAEKPAGENPADETLTSSFEGPAGGNSAYEQSAQRADPETPTRKLKADHQAFA